LLECIDNLPIVERYKYLSLIIDEPQKFKKDIVKIKFTETKLNKMAFDD